ncbi:glutamate 5-kinase [Tepiditoga spiralis]|uniref:Glutamate 5-kinase n=1 Tax=Tepiditoga spiralis TaxID=2108365 RepID=A0A7G1G1N4_9BACT|nr:glutamate 5-kinase [Tepiditoga spiralis]BBE30120.1 glutamate 5-kinase [Tepiditoga spiralis]
MKKTNIKRIVIKVGSNLLIKDGEINKTYIIELSRKISNLYKRGIKVILISSGANAAGLNYLNLSRAKTLLQKQAICSIGQVQMMKIYENAFNFFGQKISQILLTKDDFTNRKRFLNLKNTLIGLNQLNILPIINENDSISTEEIMFGDNDMLSAMFSIGWNADGLMLMTSVDGVYNDEKKIMKEFKDESSILSMKKTSYGSGGINSKIDSAKLSSNSGIKTCICNGKKLENIDYFINNESCGTMFFPKKKIKNRKAWIIFLSKSKGRVFINSGAKEALEENKSLLSIGVIKVYGSFEKGDVVDIYDENEDKIGKGIINYSYIETVKIIGKKSSEFEKILGYYSYDELIHRDNIGIVK